MKQSTTCTFDARYDKRIFELALGSLARGRIESDVSTTSGGWLSVISYLLSARSRQFDPVRNWRVGKEGRIIIRLLGSSWSLPGHPGREGSTA